MAEPLTRLLADVSRSKAGTKTALQHCAHASCPAKVEIGIYGVSKAHTHSFGTSCQPKSGHCHKTSSSSRVFASPELYHISSPCLQGARLCLCSQETQLFLGKVDLHPPQLCVVKPGCHWAWRILSPPVTSCSPRCRAQGELQPW